MEKSLDSYHSQVRFSLSLHTLGLGELVYLAEVLIIADWVLTQVNALIWPLLGNVRWKQSVEYVLFKYNVGGISLNNFN